MLNGRFMRQAASECGIALSTSFRWRHKFLKLTNNLIAQHLDGIVEIDETHSKPSEKGGRELTRVPRNLGTDKEKSKVKVVIAKDRSGHIFDKVMSRFKLDALKPDLLPKLELDIVLYSDGHLNYYWLTEKEGLKHVMLNERDKERLKDKVFSYSKRQ